MEEVSCTQNDLMQVMQKLLNERKKVKTLEKEVLHLRQDPTSSLMPTLAQPERTPTPIEHASFVDEKNDALLQLQESANQQLLAAKQLSEAKKIESEREVLLLKNIIKELAEKLKEANSKPAPIQPEPSLSEAPLALIAPIVAPPIIAKPAPVQMSPQEGQDSSTWQLKHNLYHAQNEIRLVKERSASLEEEILRLQQFRSTIQAELKEQKIKAYEGELAKQAIAQDLVKVQETNKDHQVKLEEELRQASAQIRILDEEIKSSRLRIAELSESESSKGAPFTLLQESVKEIQLSSELHEKSAKLHKLELVLEDQQLLFYEISAKNKELELKNSSLTTEKQAAITQLQETSKGLTLKEILYKEIIREKETLFDTCKQLEQELNEQKNLLNDAREDAKKIKAQNQDSSLQIADLEKKCQKLEEKDTIIEEKELAIEQLQLKNAALETQENDCKNQIELLEQHLTRKVKECTQLASVQEEQESVMTQLQVELHEKNTKLDALSSELVSFSVREKELIEQATFANEDQENRLSAQYELLQNQAQEIDSLKKIAEKYLVLEQLLGRISSTLATGDIMNTPEQGHHFPNEAPHTPQKSQPAPFLQNSPILQKPIVKEPPKQHTPRPSPTANDLFISPKDKAVRHDFFQ